MECLRRCSGRRCSRRHAHPLTLHPATQSRSLQGAAGNSVSHNRTASADAEKFSGEHAANICLFRAGRRAMPVACQKASTVKNVRTAFDTIMFIIGHACHA